MSLRLGDQPEGTKVDRRAAERIVPMLLKCAQDVFDTIEIYKQFATREEAATYALAVGDAVNAIDKVLQPIINEYPDLHP